MPRFNPIDPSTLKRAQRAVALALSVEELRRAQAILLSALLGVTTAKTAEVLGVCRASVHNLKTQFLRQRVGGAGAPHHRGGRYHSLLSLEEERALIKRWARQTGPGRRLVVTTLYAALNRQVGHRVSTSVVYRILARHGWHRVAVDKPRPKAETKGKTARIKSIRTRWKLCPPRNAGNTAADR